MWNTLQKVFHFYYVPLQPKYNLKTRIMKNSITRNLLILATCLCAMPAAAQLSSNPDKFLGNITTGWGSDVDTNGFIYSQFWNQITPEILVIAVLIRRQTMRSSTISLSSTIRSFGVLSTLDGWMTSLRLSSIGLSSSILTAWKNTILIWRLLMW